MSTVEPQSAFLARFDSVWSRMRRTHILRSLCWGLVLAATGFAVLASLDYWLEVSRENRAAGLAAILIVSGALVLTWIARASRHWNRPQTAGEIEAQFPELGQAVRTSVEFGTRSAEALRAEGIQPSLVRALAEDTRHRAAPLELEAIIPTGRLQRALALAAVILTILVATVATNWEWRTAALRSLMAEQVYTELFVAPGAATLDEGTDLTVDVELTGRTNRPVRIVTRAAGSSDGWASRELNEEDLILSEPRLARYQVVLPNIHNELEYRVEAGPITSPIYRVDVRHPLAIQSIVAEIHAPAYTGVPVNTVAEGNLQVVDGSTVHLRVTLDRPPSQASLILTERGVILGPRDKPNVVEVPFTIDGSQLSATLDVSRDQTYTIVAQDSHGIQVPSNTFRIRVRYDQPPEVWFEEPEEALEVHSLVEVMLRARVRDDFGLSRAGIVFEVNNEEEYTLLEQDYRELEATLSADGSPTRQTRDALQRLLPLELFELEEKDSVTYYAFAEDNRPGAAHRTETDLRFIDIRPFRRTYRLPMEGEQGADANFPDVRLLQEIIARQRFNLNRTIRVDRKSASGSDASLMDVDRIATFEDDLSKSTHELAEFLDEREFDGSDLLFQAEAVMLSSVDSLQVAKYDLSGQQQKDALRLLIEARNTIENFVRSNASAGQRNALRSFDRLQIQRLRRPQSNADEEENPERLVERIRRLADDQELVYKTLASDLAAGGAPSDTQFTEPTEPAPSDAARPEQPVGDEPPPGNTPTEGTSTADSTNGNGNAPMNATAAQGMSRAELEQRQQDIAIELRDVESILNRIRDLTELARNRGTRAADAADNVIGSLSRGQTAEAIDEARDTSEALRELALNVEGVLAGEAAQKIGIARDLAGMVALAERRLAAEADPTPEPQGTGDNGDDTTPPSQGSQGAADATDEEHLRRMTRRAARLAESGSTMEDILNSVMGTNSPGDREAARRVDEILSPGSVQETVQRMGDLPQLLGERRMRDARVEGEDIADRLDITARQLDQAHRIIVTPRVEQLMQLESQAVALEQRLAQLESQQQISQWHRDAAQLLEEIDKAGVATPQVDELNGAMEQDGYRQMVNGRWSWRLGSGGSFEAPERYGTAVRGLIEELQLQMQELALSDIVTDRQEATPPKYKHLVDRYIEVLSSDVREAR